MILSLTSKRLMNQLACRFCANNEFVHVVDPLLDLRHRFNDKQQLRTMLKARRFDVNVDDVEAKYQRWWKAYECVCADQLKVIDRYL
ncbi:unnamed protein product [Anisakis simplex]|uniref:Transposase n=1 Tax=Anisakis simplex TaxID=6269 RepID=A0A0M3KKI6_ANISI|nr:unnamed protein product [Anisakis simplex]